MGQSAKVFQNGRRQAVCLPAALRFDTKDVFVRRGPLTGDVVLSARPSDWDELFMVTERFGVEGTDFPVDRGDAGGLARGLL